jgi:hypothetical protein
LQTQRKAEKTPTQKGSETKKELLDRRTKYDPRKRAQEGTTTTDTDAV